MKQIQITKQARKRTPDEIDDLPELVETTDVTYILARIDTALEG